MLRGIHIEKLYYGKDADASERLRKWVSYFNKGVSSAYWKCLFQCFFSNTTMDWFPRKEREYVEASWWTIWVASVLDERQTVSLC